MHPYLLAVTVLAVSLQTPAAVHDKTYWRSIVDARFEVPAGTTAQQLAPELLTALASTDPELRDDLASTILTSWIYRTKRLGPDDLRPMTLTLEANLRKGVGAIGTDGVLLRSFSALTLSVIAARDNEAPFLSAEEYATLLDEALAYFRDERDTRGFDPAKGWMHSAAHTADLLKFLARSPRLPVAGQSRMLSAMLAKNRESPAPFTQGEDERMARIAISLARRADFDRDSFRAWLTTAQAASAFPKTPTPDALRAQQNVRHLLTALWTELSVDERPSDGAEFAKQALRETLKALF